MAFYRRAVRAPRKLFDTDCRRNLAGIAAPDIECQHPGHGLAVIQVAELAVQPYSFRKPAFFSCDGRSIETLVPFFAPQLRQWNEDKRVGALALEETVEVNTMLARYGKELETVNPQANFYRLIFVFFLRHSEGTMRCQLDGTRIVTR